MEHYDAGRDLLNVRWGVPAFELGVALGWAGFLRGLWCTWLVNRMWIWCLVLWFGPYRHVKKFGFIYI
jgi:hypothetical protein